MVGVSGYLLLGVGIAAFGPLRYEGYNPGLVFSYVLLIIMMFAMGFSIGSRLKVPVHAIWGTDQSGTALTLLFSASLVVSFLLMTYELLSMALAGGLTLSFSNSAENYYSAYADYVRNSGEYSAHFIISSFLALPLFIAQVLGAFYFKRIGKLPRILVIYIFAATILVFTFGDGKQKQLGDIIIYVVSVVLAKQAAARIRFRVVVYIGMFIFLGVGVLLVLLAYRYQTIGVGLWNLNDVLHPLMSYREGYWIEDILGSELAFPVVMFSGYLSQGYYGLSLAFQQPFTWTYFAGSSYSISVILNQFFGTDFFVNQNYPYLVGYSTGWDQSKWHTVFSWLASDLTFPGVVVFMGFLGFVYGRAWREILLYQNPFSVMLFSMMNVGWAYAPANNQLMHSPGALLTTLGVFALYFIFHANFNVTPTLLRAYRFKI